MLCNANRWAAFHEASLCASLLILEPRNITDDIGNNTMKSDFGLTLAAPALVLTATSGCSRALWAANWRRLELDIRA